MHAMMLNHIGRPLEWTELADRQPGAGEIRVKVLACGVCRTDLHVVDGELPAVATPIIPGHEIVGRIDAIGPGVTGLTMGERVGIPWLGHTCGECPYCRMNRENLCDRPLFTGYTRDGGYATATVAELRDLEHKVTRAAAVRRAHWLAFTGDRGCGEKYRSLWLWRRRAHHCPSREMAAPFGVRVRAARG